MVVVVLVLLVVVGGKPSTSTSTNITTTSSHTYIHTLPMTHLLPQGPGQGKACGHYNGRSHDYTVLEVCKYHTFCFSLQVVTLVPAFQLNIMARSADLAK